MHGGHSVVYDFQVEMVFMDQNIVIPIDKQKGNLPVVQNYLLKSKENNLYVSQLRCALDYLIFRELNFFGYICPTNILCHALTEKEVQIEG